MLDYRGDKLSLKQSSPNQVGFCRTLITNKIRICTSVHSLSQSECVENDLGFTLSR